MIKCIECQMVENLNKTLANMNVPIKFNFIDNTDELGALANHADARFCDENGFLNEDTIVYMFTDKFVKFIENFFLDNYGVNVYVSTGTSAIWADLW